MLSAIGITAAMLLSACGSKKDANKSNFADAIQSYLDTRNGVCISLPAKEAPFRLEKKTLFDIIHAQEKATAMVSAGLLSARDIEMPQPGTNKLVAGTEYSLTDSGKKFLVKGGSGNLGNWDGFCGGKYKVREVENFTEPADMFGAKISQVNYTYEVDGVPAWTKDSSLQAQFPNLVTALAPTAGDKAVLVATNDGWMHEMLFKKRGG
ncbi:hypothetical protein CR51_02080 [Caballeronia megalochromosomata]|nr:hypothetical protein CR51_02080 [Caballeronia megalochromosomata]